MTLVLLIVHSSPEKVGVNHVTGMSAFFFCTNKERLPGHVGSAVLPQLSGSCVFHLSVTGRLFCYKKPPDSRRLGLFN